MDAVAFVMLKTRDDPPPLTERRLAPGPVIVTASVITNSTVVSVIVLLPLKLKSIESAQASELASEMA
jgi:hypothetical protein